MKKQNVKQDVKSLKNGSLLVYCEECAWNNGTDKCQCLFHKTSSQPYIYTYGSLCWSFKFKEELWERMM